ncbi:MAG: DUF5711 family protein [Clostridia bacterium]|nr:DUF5711 family protein [Clostridia bacterium]
MREKKSSNKKGLRENRRRNVDIDNNEEELDLSKGLQILNVYKEKKEEDRQKRMGKTSTEYVDENQEEVKRSVSIKPIVFCFIIIVIVFALYMLIEYGPILGISLNGEYQISDKSRIDIVSTDEDIYKSYNSQLLVYTNQTIKLYDNNVKETLNFKLPEIFTPDIITSEKYMAVVNKSNGKIYLFEGNNEILDKKIEGTIQNLYLDEKGNFVVEYSSPGFKKILGVYNKNGKNLYNSYIDNNPIIKLKIIDNSNRIIFAQANSDSLTIGVSVKKIDGKKSKDNIEDIAKLENSMLYDLTINDQNIIMVLDSKIVKYNMKSKKLDTVRNYDTDQLSFVLLSKSYYATLQSNLDDENKYVIETNKFDGTKIAVQKINNLPKVIKNSGLLTYIINQNELQVMNKWGFIIKDLKLELSPKDIVIFNNEKSVALIYSNKIYILTI